MKELRWVIRFKGNPYTIKTFKRKWAAKVYLFFFKIKHCHKKFSLTYEKVNIQN